MNTAPGQSRSVVLATPASVVSVAQSGGFCDGMVRLDGRYPVSMRTILMPSLPWGVAKDGDASPFAMPLTLCAHSFALVLSRDGARRIWQHSFRDLGFMLRRHCRLGLRGPMWSGFLRD